VTNDEYEPQVANDEYEPQSQPESAAADDEDFYVEPTPKKRQKTVKAPVREAINANRKEHEPENKEPLAENKEPENKVSLIDYKITLLNNRVVYIGL
jgi:hypothetical protein